MFLFGNDVFLFGNGMFLFKPWGFPEVEQIGGSSSEVGNFAKVLVAPPRPWGFPEVEQMSFTFLFSNN